MTQSYFGIAMPRSAARECPASSWRVVLAHPALAETCPRLRCPVWFSASGKIPGSIWPFPGQQVYERISVPGINRGETQTACTPPWEEALYHLIPSQVCSDDSKFYFRWSLRDCNGINVNETMSPSTTLLKLGPRSTVYRRVPTIKPEGPGRRTCRTS